MIVVEYQDAAISGSTLLRPGFQNLQTAMRAGSVDIVLAEALDRFSRDQEHVAAFHKLAGFTGIRLVTLTEGEVNMLHIGVKGTMNALYLQDLAAKTRRGMEGRVLVGRTIGPPPYGYRRIVGRLRPDGEPERGIWEIAPDQAAIVNRIYQEFAAGHSAIAISRRLNADAIPAPQGKGWQPMSLRGRPSHGDGILRNPIYAGRNVWNRSPRLQAKLSTLKADRDRLAKSAEAAKPTVVRLLPNLGEAYRRKLARLRDQLSGQAQNREAVTVARQLIERVVIHPAPPRKPPGITVEGHLARMLTMAQGDLPDGVAIAIANAAQLSVKEGTGDSVPRGAPSQAGA